MSWFSKKKQSPPKKKPLTLNDISILLAKTKEYIGLDKQKKINECLSQEQRLVQMLKAPQRNRKDEEIQILKIGNILNQIEAYEKATIIVANLDSMKGQVTACNGDASKIQQIIPYVASICFYIEKANDLRGAVDLKLRMNEYFNCDVANTYERAVDPEARRLFSPINIQSPVVQKYAQDFSKKYTIFDVPGLPYNPIQPANPSSGFPSPYPSNGGYPQNQQGGYPQNQQGGYPQNQQGGYPQNQQGGYPQNQQGMYPQQQMQSSNQYPQQQMNNGQYPQQGVYPGQGNQGGQQQQNGYPIQTFNKSNSLTDPYSQLKGTIYQNNPNQYLPQITQPNIGMANRTSSNFDYPSLSKIIKPPEANADTFVPLQPPLQNNNEPIIDPFAALDQLKNQQMKELPIVQPSQQNFKSNNNNQSQNNPYPSQNQQQQNNQFPSSNQYINQQQSNNNQQQNSQYPSSNQYNNQQQQNNNQLQSQNSNNPYINLQQKNDQSILNNPLSQMQQKGAQNSQLNQYQNIQSYNNQQGNNNFNSFTPANEQQGSLGQQISQPSQMTGNFKQDEFQSQNLAHLKNPLDSNIGGMVETKTLNEENGPNQSQVVGQALINHDLRSLEILRAFCLDRGQQIQDSKQIIEMILREI